ncbi:MAG: hypothetical protein AB7P76_03225 [Candidatus Melainabacteria bacterium]
MKRPQPRLTVSTLTRQSLALLSALSLLGATTPVLAQSLPPLQDPGYQTPGYTTYPQQQPAPQAQNYSSYNGYSNYSNTQIQGHIATAPAGTFMTATFQTPLSSEFARVGDRFNASLATPITGTDGSVILPAGSQLEAQVVMVQPAGRTGKSGQLDVRFTSALLPSGQRIPLSARIKTEDGTGIITGGNTKERVGKTALNTALGAGLGAALGTAMGPLSGGSVGRGAIYGTAIGGGAGLAKGLWNKGDEAVITTGQPLNVVLDQPLTVNPGAAAAPAYAQPNTNTYQPYNQSQYNNYNNNYGY